MPTRLAIRLCSPVSLGIVGSGQKMLPGMLLQRAGNVR